MGPVRGRGGLRASPRGRGTPRPRLCGKFIYSLVYSMQRYRAQSGDEDGSQARLCGFSSVSPENQNKAEKNNPDTTPISPLLPLTLEIKLFPSRK